MTVAGTDPNGSAGQQLSVMLPPGWTSPSPYFAGNDAAQPSTGAAFFASVVDNTFSDPCAHVQRSPKVGSTVEAVATALGEIPHTTATEPVQTTLAGHKATYLELTYAAPLPCAPNEFYLWQDSPGADWWALSADEMIQTWILDVGGRPVVIAARSHPGTPDATQAELQQALDSIVFDATS